MLSISSWKNRFCLSIGHVLQCHHSQIIVFNDCRERWVAKELPMPYCGSYFCCELRFLCHLEWSRYNGSSAESDCQICFLVWNYLWHLCDNI
ncbi:hypothetical protein LOK49_LG08G00075 [Camellia lanceoleosa]|uniref:Uncharacterized protein n=1 Tax=Camellia lanceoleosa TaxID=1840588 RepID=A0ACC0GSQ8_9ERIC|nr:hypothetical protein LOK49_LG08G00075 [Camellia lanceoleosa]